VNWRLLYTGALPGALNMGIDEAILQSVAAGGVPTLRFYAWNPPAISLGCFQDAYREIDMDACRELGVDVVRRPTGGRAVLHDVEVTYSLILPEANSIIPRGITESYRSISEGMVRGLASLGLDVKMVSLRRRKSQGGAGEEQRAGEAASDTAPIASQRYVITVDAPDKKSLSAACFDAPSWYEVAAGGKKIVGSAQVRRCGVLLQHGSIPLALDADKLFACLKFPDDAARERAKAAFLAKATSVRDALGRELSFEQVSEAVAKGLAMTLGITLVKGELLSSEEEAARELARTKYSHIDWHKESGRGGVQTA